MQIEIIHPYTCTYCTHVHTQPPGVVKFLINNYIQIIDVEVFHLFLTRTVSLKFMAQNSYNSTEE